MRSVISILSGALFGVGLFLSGMTDTTKVQGWLDFFGSWDPTLAFVMGGAIVPMAVAWRLVSARHGLSTPLSGGQFPTKPDMTLDRNLVLGSVLFGAGWALAGLCPGPAIASLSFGGWQGALFVTFMLIGMRFTPGLRFALDRRVSSA